LVSLPTTHPKISALRRHFRSGHGPKNEPCKNQIGIKCGIESPSAHETSVLEAGIDFSSSTCAPSLFLIYHFKIFTQEEFSHMAESIPPVESIPRNRLPVAINVLKYLCYNQRPPLPPRVLSDL
jgi:hypothetical protein